MPLHALPTALFRILGLLMAGHCHMAVAWRPRDGVLPTLLFKDEAQASSAPGGIKMNRKQIEMKLTDAITEERAAPDVRRGLWLHMVVLIKTIALLATITVGQAQQSVINIGVFQLTVPQGSTVQQLENGIVQLNYAHEGTSITAQLQAQQGLSPGDEQLPRTMQAWNVQYPMQPLGEAWSIVGFDHLSGFIKGHWYEQPYQDRAGPNILHGLFVLVTQKTGDGLAIDVFSNGPSREAQDWQVLSDYATTILNHTHQQY
jgi:hypothetical protein